MSRICKHQPRPTDEQREMAAAIKKTGGTLTADELAHSNAFIRVGSAWTGARAAAWIKRHHAEGKWLDAHAHADGSIYIPRTDVLA